MARPGVPLAGPEEAVQDLGEASALARPLRSSEVLEAGHLRGAEFRPRPGAEDDGRPRKRRRRFKQPEVPGPLPSPPVRRTESAAELYQRRVAERIQVVRAEAHVSHVIQGRIDIAWCERCGSVTTPGPGGRLNKLATPCGALTVRGEQNLSRIRRGMNPITGEQGGAM